MTSIIDNYNDIVLSDTFQELLEYEKEIDVNTKEMLNEIMDAIDDAKKRNAINDLSVIAYRLVNMLIELSGSVKKN